MIDGDAPSDPSLAHRLPRTVTPRRYDLHLAPDLDAATFTGTVRIEAEVDEPTDTVVLNAAELAVETATVTSAGETLAAEVAFDEAAERVALRLPRPLAAGPCTIEAAFAGTLNDRLRGLYRSTYVDDGGESRTLAVTQFEATDARRAFPCFDEPDRKAVFALSVDVADGHQAFSNGPVVSEEPRAGGGRRIRFGETIAMSSYLVALVVGPLEATEPVDVDGTPVRVVHVPGKGHLAPFALEVAAHALRFFSDWFAIAYPAEKLDLVAIPDFAFGAMENLGCVTFRETALLVDRDRSSQLEQQRVCDVVNHELAHMWFGDLVTMRWWNGIWLNEAFATFMELLATDAFRPGWARWVSFGMERDVAMAVDALHRTRPVEYPVGSPDEAQGMFDVLTYQKGAGVLRMLERYLGPDAFRAGIRRYLDRHRLSNTETGDLWDALEEASGQPVRHIMDTWILQGGFPLVHAETDGATVTLRQEPFALSPPDGPSAIGDHWLVPVLVGTAGGEGTAARALVDEPVSVSVDGVAVVNAGGSGYFRVRYRPDHLRRLADAFSTLAPLERFNLLGDAWAAVVAGRAELADLLVLADALGDEDDPDVWGQLSAALGFLQRAAPEEALGTLAGYTRRRLGPTFGRLGWTSAEGEGMRTGTLRAQLVSGLGVVGEDEAVRSEARARLAAELDGSAPIDPELAGAVVAVVAATGGPDDFDAFVDRYRHPSTPQEEVRFLQALAGFRDPELAGRAFDLALTEVRTQNAPFLLAGLLANRWTGEATWERIEARFDEVAARTPANILPRMLESVRFLCRSRPIAERVRAFVADHPVAAGQRTVDQAVERLFVNVALAERLAPDLQRTLDAAAR